ncbi:helix-turn-helix transcriptional regulator [Pseudomonas putida]|uniref:helix-turn-helix transcriptional regulator n=1 Tax=Pseudomonas putida TaxID=303 RepID=UPI003D98347C
MPYTPQPVAILGAPIMNTTPLPRTILRIHDLQKAMGLSRTKIYELIAEGKFPKGKPIAGLHAVGWDSLAVQDWINNQLDHPQ